MLSREGIRAAMERGDIALSPFDENGLKEASYTFRLSGKLSKIEHSGPIDLRQGKPKLHEIAIGKGYTLQPREFILGYTLERLTLSARTSCMLSGRGSVAQIGLDVVQSSFFAEPLSDAPMILEISNNGPNPIVLYEGMPVVKGVFFEITGGRSRI